MPSACVQLINNNCAFQNAAVALIFAVVFVLQGRVVAE